MLAIFDGRRGQDNVSLSVSGPTGSVAIPDAFIRYIPGETAKEKLENEIYQSIQSWGEVP
jgi:hypothetical protein